MMHPELSPFHSHVESSIMKHLPRYMAMAAVLALPASLSAQSFNSGPLAGSTCTGNCGTIGANGNIGLSGNVGSTAHGWVSTASGVSAREVEAVERRQARDGSHRAARDEEMRDAVGRIVDEPQHGHEMRHLRRTCCASSRAARRCTCPE